MASKLKPGDRVAWDSAQGEVKGKVVKKIEQNTQIKGYAAKASKDNPEYLVRSDNTGAKAAHKLDALKKR